MSSHEPNTEQPPLPSNCETENGRSIVSTGIHQTDSVNGGIMREGDNYSVFENSVKRCFDFLQEYGFRRLEADQSGYVKLIRYESPGVFVNLFYGPPAYEPEMSFGRIGIYDAAEAYSFDQGDLILLDACRDWKWEPAPQRGLDGFICEFARLLNSCGSECLAGDSGVYREMRKRRDIAVKVSRQQEFIGSIRRDAEKAWRKRDYIAYIALISKIKDTISDLERSRLNYARKHLQLL